jgi:hypothetical protein
MLSFIIRCHETHNKEGENQLVYGQPQSCCRIYEGITDPVHQQVAHPLGYHLCGKAFIYCGPLHFRLDKNVSPKPNRSRAAESLSKSDSTITQLWNHINLRNPEDGDDTFSEMSV